MVDECCTNCHNAYICKWKNDYDEIRKKIEQLKASTTKTPFRVVYKCEYFKINQAVREGFHVTTKLL